MLVRLLGCTASLGFAALIGSCGGDERAATQLQSAAPDRPDEPPVMVNKELPFRYPAPLYAQRVQGNVTLRLFIDRDGRILPESTRVDDSSGYPPLDSAAIKGSQELYFVPAKLHGEAVGVTVLFPVYFRHPEAAPLPGDSILAKREAASTKRPADQGASTKPPASGTRPAPVPRP